MKKVIALFEFEENAKLLDSRIYIIKVFLAIATAYGLGIRTELVKADMISVLFGLMLTLEPVNITGIKNGWNQIYATMLGVVATFIIISLFGVNILTVPVAVVLTLYIGIKINWREVPVVAFFTAIYMTQYVQIGPFGEPSPWLTAQLRLLALIYGVVIGIIFNLIFSFIAYKRMPKKRLKWMMKTIYNLVEELEIGLKSKDINVIKNINKVLPNVGGDIDWIYRLFLDSEKENQFKNKILNQNKSIQKEINILFEIKSLNHALYDFTHYLERKEYSILENNDAVDEFCATFNIILKKIENVEKIFENEESLNFNKFDENHEEIIRIIKEKSFKRLSGNLKEILYCMDTIEEILMLE